MKWSSSSRGTELPYSPSWLNWNCEVPAMNAIYRQARANLRGHRLQGALILISLMAAAALLTLALNTFHVAQGAFDRLFERSNGAHLWLTVDPVVMAAEEVERTVGGLPGVEETSRAYRTLSTVMFLGDIRESGMALRPWPSEEDRVARPVLTAGRAPRAGELDAMVLDRNAAVEYRVGVGDPVGVLTPTGRQDLTIVGLFVSTEVCPTCFPYISYVAPGAMEALGLLPSPEADVGALRIGLRLADPNRTQAVLQEAEAALPADSIYGWVEWQDLRQYADSSIELQRILLLTFSVVAGLAAGLLIANTIGGTIRAQTRQVGLLKAIGFTGRQLVLVYMLEYMGLALTAGLIGFAAGSVLAVATLRSVTLLFGDTSFTPAPWTALATLVSTLLITAVFLLLAVRRAVRLDVVEAIRAGKEHPRRQGSQLLSGTLKRLPAPLSVGLRTVLSQPVHAILTVLAMGTAVITIVSALALQSTFQAILTDPAQLGFEGDLFLRRSDYYSEAQVRQLIASQPEVTSYYSERWLGFQFPGENRYYQARFRGEDLSAFRFPVVEGRMFAGHGEAVAGYGLVTERGIQVGDQIQILINDRPFTVKVVGLYRENSNNGRMLLLPAETLQQALPGAETFTFVLKIDPGADPQAVADAITRATNDFVGVRVMGEEELPSSIRSLPGIMTALTLVLGSIAALAVLNNVWMAVQGRRRELAMLKAVGMTREQVMLSVLSGVAVLAVLAYVVGLPAGMLGIRLLVDTVARSIGFGPLVPWMDRLGLVLLLPEILAIALVGASIPAYRAGRTGVLEVLRYE
jgi:putative ABC transport system permease protein